MSLDQLFRHGFVMTSKQLSCILAATVLLICGCDTDWPSDSSMCQVSGQITLEGEAVPGVKIAFVPQRTEHVGQPVSRIASATSDDRGEFHLVVDSKSPKLIHHDRYRVIVSKIVDGRELFHKSYNTESVLVVEIDTQESIQRPKLELVATGML